jgi:hypothetical protein
MAALAENRTVFGHSPYEQIACAVALRRKAQCTKISENPYCAKQETLVVSSAMPSLPTP